MCAGLFCFQVVIVFCFPSPAWPGQKKSTRNKQFIRCALIVKPINPSLTEEGISVSPNRRSFQPYSKPKLFPGDLLYQRRHVVHVRPFQVLETPSAYTIDHKGTGSVVPTSLTSRTVTCYTSWQEIIGVAPSRPYLNDQAVHFLLLAL